MYLLQSTLIGDYFRSVGSPHLVPFEEAERFESIRLALNSLQDVAARTGHRVMNCQIVRVTESTEVVE